MHLHVISFKATPFVAWRTTDMLLRFQGVVVVEICQGTSFRICNIILVCTLILKLKKKSLCVVSLYLKKVEFAYNINCVLIRLLNR